MKQDRIAAAARKARRRVFTPLLFRRIHKWMGLVIGFQIVVWTLSGTAMALLDMGAVAGPAPQPQLLRPWPARLAPPPPGPAEALTLRQLLGRPVYQVESGGETRLFDATTGAPLRIGAPTAIAVARHAWSVSAPVDRVRLLSEPNLESRDHEGPVWRIDFAGAGARSAYVQGRTGEPLVVRSTTWRLWDVAWMLHNMDYAERKSFNHPLIIFAGFAALWVSLTGFYLIFKSFRRREFRWILRS